MQLKFVFVCRSSASTPTSQSNSKKSKDHKKHHSQPSSPPVQHTAAVASSYAAVYGDDDVSWRAFITLCLFLCVASVLVRCLTSSCSIWVRTTIQILSLVHNLCFDVCVCNLCHSNLTLFISFPGRSRIPDGPKLRRKRRQRMEQRGRRVGLIRADLTVC